MHSLNSTSAPRERASLSSSWQQALAASISDPEILLRQLDLPLEWLPAARAAARRFRLRVPPGYLARIRPGDPLDPLLRQILPLHEELDADPPGYTADAVGDLTTERSPGLLHKYHGRALLITTGACAIHCRYCFRRLFPYGDSHVGGGRLDHAIRQIEQDSSLTEIILSGGDPLSLSNDRLQQLVQRLDGIDHLQTLRVHSRLPTVVPERVDDALLDLFRRSRLRCVFVTHVNHPREIDTAVGDMLEALAKSFDVLLNQSVLLKGVNDRADSLIELSHVLFRHGVLPYYLHLPDKVSGTAHFDVPEARGRRLLAAMAAELPGYLVPRLAREEAGRSSKTLLGF